MRPISFDATHLIVRQGVPTPTGIDRVDHAYAQALSMADDRAVGVQCLFKAPKLLRAGEVRALCAALSRTWGEGHALEEETAFAHAAAFLRGEPGSGGRKMSAAVTRSPLRIVAGARKITGLVSRLLRTDTDLSIPDGALFVNVTANPELMPHAGRLLAARPDLKAVFLVHDLIAIDYPEYFPAGRKQRFEGVLDVMIRHAAAFITTTGAVRDRLQHEIRRRNGALRPIHVAPLPLPPGFDEPLAFDPVLAGARYVVMVGTVEPRKNHWLILNLWRHMLRAGEDPPRLVIIGAMGWENDAIATMIARSPGLSDVVLHVSGLSNKGLRAIVGHARALLMPSFIEGYGIPVIEAAALGTPVLASDTTVFGEVSQGLATLIDPLDGPGWRRAILAVAGPGSAARRAPIAPLPGFVPPTNAAYFADVKGFLASL
jgi:glycosyltransferase involved in cell wall biosynthesis